MDCVENGSVKFDTACSLCRDAAHVLDGGWGLL